MKAAYTGLQTRIRLMAEQRTLLCAAVVAVLCVVAADVVWLAGCAFAILLGSMAGLLLGWRKGVAMVCIGLAATLVLHGRKLATERERVLLQEYTDVRVTAKVLEDARGSSRAWIAEARILEGPARGAKVVWRGRGAMPVAGSHVSAKGTFSPPEPERNRGEFDRAAWMERMGLAAEFHARDVRTQNLHTPWLAAWAARFRHGFETSILHGLDGESQAAQVISAMVVGKHPPDADEMITAFRNSGTLHVFTVSE